MIRVDNTYKIDQKLIDTSMAYNEYIQLLEDLFEQGKTTGENQSEDLLNYAKLNLQRMRRLNKTTSLNEDIKNFVEDEAFRKMTFLVLTEGWCGDAAQILPPINMLSDSTSNIDLRLILRDENLEVMDQFLTNGSRSIPKLIALNKNNEVIGTWGPRPKLAQEVVEQFKRENPNAPHSELSANLQLWYTRNKTQAIQTELFDNLKDWVKQYNK